jgi:hypothetical protein
MSVEESAAEREFFLSGAKLCLDVEDALEEFRRQVYDKCASVVRQRLSEMGRACKVNLSSPCAYKYNDPTGSSREIGAKLLLQGLGNGGGLYCCLELYREDGQSVCGALVYLYRSNGKVANALWSRLEDSPTAGGYRKGNTLIFEHPIPQDDTPHFEKYLNNAIDDFITFISRYGGLKQYI